MRKKISFAIIAMLFLASGMRALAATPYAVYCEGDKSLHFLGSSETLSVGQELTSNGQTITTLWELDLSATTQSWYRSDVTKVIFEESFKNFKPTCCSNWFYNFSKLEEIEGLQYFNTANVTDMHGMFYGCHSLTSLDVSSFNTANVTDMSAMFGECHPLSSLDLSSFNTESVTSMRNMFFGCISLSSLDLSSFNTENVTDMSGMFNACSSLTSLDLSNFNTENVTDMDYMFYCCSSLTSLDVSSFNTANVTGMVYMFNGCISLTSLDLSSFNTGNEIFISGMFRMCTSLKSLNLSNFNPGKVSSDGEFLDGCTSLTYINFSSLEAGNVMEIIFYEIRDVPNLRTLVLGSVSSSSINSLRANQPEVLIFVNEVSGGDPDNKTNLVIGDECENLVINYGTTTNNQLRLKIPHTFTANNVTVNRSFTNDRPYTLYLPFEMDASQYGTFYTGGKFNEADNMVYFTRLTEEKTTPNAPYMFLPDKDFTAGITIEGPVTVEVTPDDTETDGLNGVYEKKEFTAGDVAQKIYYGWANGEFCWAEEGAKVDACRAYFKLPASAAAKAPARLKANFGDYHTTGITEIDREDGDTAPAAYNISGQRVGSGYRGVVIKNGQKTAGFAR
ncbi:MAG: DUF285 domain-containing protein [Muribaculaceae bacterium]|nr:DUF285 domain-containing protein [Muribaculaceae bacterium]